MDVDKERHVLEVWGTYYRGALATTEDIEVGGASAETRAAIAASQARVAAAVAKARTMLKPE